MNADKPKSPCALVVDDDSDVRDFVSTVLAGAGCEVHVAKDGEQALVHANSFQPDIVFLDIKIPEQSGWLVGAKLKLVEPSPTVVFMTGLPGDHLNRCSEIIKVRDVLKKPFSADDVLAYLAPAVT